MNNRNTILTTILLTLASFALLQSTQAVVPAPDGGYPGFNTAEGQNALFSLTTGDGNTAVGWFSLRSNAVGSFNTATGAGTLLFNTADENTALGAAALLNNISGASNTATGAAALSNNTTGGGNTANGAFALQTNTGGIENTATGAGALTSNTIGNNNTAVGFGALGFNAADFNTAVGSSVLNSNTTGTENTGVGFGALGLNTGSENTALGAGAGFHLTTGDNNIDIGYGVQGMAGESNTIRIGNTDITDTFIRGIFGATSSGGAAVFINSNGHLGTMTSSTRFKDEIKPMDKASEAILALNPVSFRYKREIDPQGIPQFGLVAEEVEKVSPDLIVRDKEGKPYSVRYDQVNAMLLNEFLKEHHQVQDLKTIVAQQQKQIEALTAGLQKVSAQVEAGKPAPQVVNNP